MKKAASAVNAIQSNKMILTLRLENMLLPIAILARPNG
jgi:hypothetical protein